MAATPPPTPVPETLDWDLWLGPAAARPFTAGDAAYAEFVTAREIRYGRKPPPEEQRFGYYAPFNWRGFYDFGSSLIGDWGIHILGPANWALQLHPRYLESVECIRKDALPPTTFPDELAIRYDFGPRPGMPPVSVFWYHHGSGDAYTPPGMSLDDARKIPGTGPQVGPQPGQGGFYGGSGGSTPAPPRPARNSGYNCIFVGSKGYLGTSGRGEGVGLLPGSRWAEYKLPDPYLQRSPGASTGSNHSSHARDWVRACKGGAPACSHFGIAGPFTEWLVLGAAAVHYEGKLTWDDSRGEFSNNKDANKWIKPAYRKGWTLKI